MHYQPIDAAAAMPAAVTFDVSRDTFAPIATAAAKLIPARTGLPILSNVMVCVDAAGLVTLSATDMDVQLTATVTADSLYGLIPGAFTVSARALSDLFRKAPRKSIVCMRAADGRLVLTYGRARQSLATLPVDDFPVIGTADLSHSYSIDGDTLHRDLSRLAPVQSTEQQRYYLMGIAVQPRDSGLRMVATDGNHALHITRPLPIGAAGVPELIIPRVTVGHLIRELKARPGVNVGVTVNEQGSRMSFAMPGITIVSKAIDGNFPDVDRCQPTGELAHMVELDAATLATRMSAAATREFHGGRDSHALTVDATESGIRSGWHARPAAYSSPAVPGNAEALAGTYCGPGAAFTLPRSVASTFKAMGGTVSLAWGEPHGGNFSVSLLSSSSAPEIGGMVMLGGAGAFPAPVESVPTNSTYTAPAGQAACLFAVAAVGFDEKPRKANETEVIAYLRDYAGRAGLSVAGGVEQRVIRAGYGEAAAVCGVTFGTIKGVARHETLKELASDGCTVVERTVYLPERWSDGALSVIMPGTNQPAAMYDAGNGWAAMPTNAKGEIALSRAAVRDLVGVIDKPAKEKPVRAPLSPSQPVDAAAGAVEPETVDVDAGEALPAVYGPVAPPPSMLAADSEAESALIAAGITDASAGVPGHIWKRYVATAIGIADADGWFVDPGKPRRGRKPRVAKVAISSAAFSGLCDRFNDSVIPAAIAALANAVPVEAAAPVEAGTGDAPPPYTVSPARYAAGKMMVRADDGSGYKCRAARLIGDGFGCRWVNRGKGYVASPTQVAKFERLYAAGFDAAVMTTGELYHPETRGRYSIAEALATLSPTVDAAAAVAIDEAPAMPVGKPGRSLPILIATAAGRAAVKRGAVQAHSGRLQDMEHDIDRRICAIIGHAPAGIDEPAAEFMVETCGVEAGELRVVFYSGEDMVWDHVVSVEDGERFIASAARMAERTAALEPVDAAPIAPPAGESALVATVAALVARVAALESAGGMPLPSPVDAPPAKRERSPAHMRGIRAYLAARRQRVDLAFANAVIAAGAKARRELEDSQVAFNGRQNEARELMQERARRAETFAAASAVREQKLLAQAARLARAARGARARLFDEYRLVDRMNAQHREAGVDLRLDVAIANGQRDDALALLATTDARLVDALRRADIAERLNRLGAGGDLPRPSLIIDHAAARQLEPVR